jgi:hypothetical protein
MSEAVNPWKELFGFESEEAFIRFIDRHLMAGNHLSNDINGDVVSFVRRIAKSTSIPVETTFRHAWHYGLISRSLGDTVEEVFAKLSDAEKAAIDLYRAMISAALITARQHVAEYEARQVTAAAIARPPVPVEDTIFERHGSTFERDPVLAAAVDAQFAGVGNMVADAVDKAFEDMTTTGMGATFVSAADDGTIKVEHVPIASVPAEVLNEKPRRKR